MVSHLAAIKMSARVEVVSESSAGEGSISTLTQIVDRIQFLKNCLTEGLSFPLAVGQRPPSGSHHMGFSSMAIYLTKVCKQSTQRVNPLARWALESLVT